MRPHELEAWVLSIIDRVESKQPVEDSRVELKAEWPTDAAKAARRLAGHCNAARGESALWVIGADEDRGLVVGASKARLPDWFSAIKAQFDGLAPDLVRDLAVPVGEKTVVALLFNTDRAPFVVKNPAHGQPSGGPVEREVPWREGTAVRSARREDLLRLLVPIHRLPKVEVRKASCTFQAGDDDSTPRGHDEWSLHLELYVEPTSSDAVAIPNHRCEAEIIVGGDGGTVPLVEITLRPVSPTLVGTPAEVYLSGPGVMLVSADGTRHPGERRDLPDAVDYQVTLLPTGSERPLQLSGRLSRLAAETTDPSEPVRWESK